MTDENNTNDQMPVGIDDTFTPTESNPATDPAPQNSKSLTDILQYTVGPYTLSVWLLMFAVILGYASYGMAMMKITWDPSVGFNGYELVTYRGFNNTDFDAEWIRFVPTVALIVIVLTGILVLLPRLRIKEINRYASKLYLIPSNIAGKNLTLIFGVLIAVLGIITASWGGVSRTAWGTQDVLDPATGVYVLVLSGLIIALLGFLETRQGTQADEGELSLLLLRSPAPRPASEPEPPATDGLGKLVQFFSNTTYMTYVAFAVGLLLIFFGLYAMVVGNGEFQERIPIIVGEIGTILAGVLVFFLAKNLYEGKIVEKVDVMSRVIMTIGMAMMVYLLFDMFAMSSIWLVFAFFVAALVYIYGEYMERDKSNETVDRIMWVLMLLGGAILTLFNAYGLIMGLKDPGLYLIMNLALILAGLFMVFLTLNPQVKARMGM